MEKVAEPTLITILHYLDHLSLKNASEVNRTWNRIINNCGSLMTKLKLDLILQQTDSVNDAFNDSKQLNHRRLVVQAVENAIVSRATKSKLLTIIDNSKIEELTLYSLPVSFQNSILSALPYIKKLFISSLYVHPTHNVMFDLPNLEEVDCVESDFILNSIKCNRIKNLRMSFITEKLFNFFERCSTLRELSIWGFKTRYDRAFNNIQLKTLKLSAVTIDTVFDIDWNLRSCQKFLESQQESLKELHIESCTIMESCDEIVVYALNHMSLKLLNADYELENGVIEKVNEELESLMINFKSNEITEQIIASCSNVKNLDLTTGKDIFSRQLPLVANQMTYLRHLKLTINFPDAVVEDNMKFICLQTLEVIFISNHIREFINFIKSCPNLESINYDMPASFQWTFKDWVLFLCHIPNVVKITSKGNFGLIPETMKLLTAQQNHLKLKLFKFIINNPRNFEALIAKFNYGKIKFILMAEN